MITVLRSGGNLYRRVQRARVRRREAHRRVRERHLLALGDPASGEGPRDPGGGGTAPAGARSGGGTAQAGARGGG